MGTRHTRRKFLNAIGAGVAWIVLLSVPGCKPSERNHHSPITQPKYRHPFHSRPDLDPPIVEVAAQAHDAAPGYIFIAPKKGAGQYGPLIVDNLGRPVWFSKNRYATDFRVQQYQGRPVVSWWEGKIVQAHGVGEYVIFDDSYQEITRVSASNGYRGDLHEFLITPHDTALLTVYEPLRMNMSSVGGPENGTVLEGIAQEIDIDTGEVLFEWRSLDHVSLDESYSKSLKNPKRPLDYFHINSIDIDYDGNWLISAKRTSTVYKVDRETGEIMWRLGGKMSDFAMGPGTRFAYQHDARRQLDGSITIFDNGAAPKVHDQSRGIVLRIDEEAMNATLVREYISPDKPLAGSQGNLQVLPNGNVFIGWGSKPYFSEFSGDGRLLFNASFPGSDQSYRAYRFQWKGCPKDKPTVAIEPGSNGTVTVYASWNGATEVKSWQVLAGPSSDQMKSIGSACRSGFETTIKASTSEPYVSVRAKDHSGRVLGTSRVARLMD